MREWKLINCHYLYMRSRTFQIADIIQGLQLNLVKLVNNHKIDSLEKQNSRWQTPRIHRLVEPISIFNFRSMIYEYERAIENRCIAWPILIPFVQNRISKRIHGRWSGSNISVTTDAGTRVVEKLRTFVTLRSWTELFCPDNFFFVTRILSEFWFLFCVWACVLRMG